MLALEREFFFCLSVLSDILNARNSTEFLESKELLFHRASSQKG